ncbi:hypothetical protein AALA24_04210 [Anaerovoracaceae bacterium 42-11]
MFSQKKKNHTWIYACAVLIVAIFAIVILIAALTGKENEEDALKANLESRVNENTANAKEPEDSADGEDLDTEDDEDTDTETNGDTIEGENKDKLQNPQKDTDGQFYQSYYLIKYDKNVIKIFFSDETGHLIELEDTSIVYETLSAQDQSRFKEGIKVENRDDLNRLMMDYES